MSEVKRRAIRTGLGGVKELYGCPLSRMGILDPDGECLNPLTGQEYSENYRLLAKHGRGEIPAWSNFPVYQHRSTIIRSIVDNQVTLIKSGTGSGKSVLVPKYALHAFGYQKKVLVTVPKKIPTERNATFAAETLDVKLGQEVGYKYRGESKVTKDTKLIFSTDGSVVSQMLGDDPLLQDISCVIIDEAHERKVNIDFLLLLLKDALSKRDDLKIIIMSATINLEVFRNYFPENKFTFGEVDAGGVETRQFEVKEYWENSPIKGDFIPVAVDKIINIMKNTNEGDIIVFVLSESNAMDACAQLHSRSKKENLNPYCIELSGRTKGRNKELAVDPFLFQFEPGTPFTRKVVMTTNVAESAVTIQGAVFVIDSGLAFIDSYNPRKDAAVLKKGWITQASATQRIGRVGRTQPGVAYHLYTKKEFESWEPYPPPDIRKSDLTGTILGILGMKSVDNVNDLFNFLNRLIEPPNMSYVIPALEILHKIGAIEIPKKISVDYTDPKLIYELQISKIGLAMRSFPTEPHLARSIIEAHYYGVRHAVTDIVAIIEHVSELDEIFVNLQLPKDKKEKEALQADFRAVTKKFLDPNGDHFTLLNIYKKYTTQKELLSKKDDTKNKDRQSENKENNEILSIEKWCEKNYLNSKRLSKISKTIKKLNSSFEQVRRSIPSMKVELFADSADNIAYSLIVGHAHKMSRQEDILKGGSKYDKKDLVVKQEKSKPKISSKKYITTFPKEKTVCTITDTTFDKLNIYPSRIIYNDLFLIESKKKLTIVSKVNDNVYKRYKKYN